jgi:transposase
MVADDGEAFLILPKFGKTKKDHGPLRIRMHRPLPVGARIKTVTLAQEADWWFASLNCEAEVAAVAPSPKPAGAADVGVEVPVMTNTGRSFTMPVLTPRRTERRRRLQRALARKKRGSANRQGPAGARPRSCQGRKEKERNTPQDRADAGRQPWPDRLRGSQDQEHDRQRQGHPR